MSKLFMLVALGQSGSGDSVKLATRRTGELGALMKVIARGLFADPDEMTMSAQDIAAHTCECKLRLGEELNRRLAFDGRHAPDVAAGGHDACHQRGYGDERVVDPKLGIGHFAFEAGGHRGY
ncbi:MULTISPECIES: hypothetical protein [Novosphingobium]|uniref:hypothetical protein n=1 Tax=Novosphingobium TaxID=165696 RepID=UPI0012DEA970|nr:MULTISPECIES: hypothetical protein [Novosphingobium]